VPENDRMPKVWGETGDWTAASVAALCLLVGCGVPDHPPPRVGSLPSAAVAYLAPDQVATFRLEEGVTYRGIRSRTHPWTVHLIEIDVTRCHLGFRVVRAEEGEGRLLVSEMARRVEPGVVAAINGDFFTPEDRPLGIELSEGELRNRTSRPVFAWRPGELPWVGRVESRDGLLAIGPWWISTEQPDRDLQVVAGFPALLVGGAPVGDLQMGDRPDFAAQRHPRTAVGFDPSRDRLWWVVVEGRRDGVSEGMTLLELVGLLRSLGVRDAINLDGGGSSVMVVRREAVSRPSDPIGGERAVVNALVLRSDPRYCLPPKVGGEG